MKKIELHNWAQLNVDACQIAIGLDETIAQINLDASRLKSLQDKVIALRDRLAKDVNIN